MGIDLLKDESNFSVADFSKGAGKLHVVGTCELNYNKVKCIADVDLKKQERFRSFGNSRRRVIMSEQEKIKALVNTEEQYSFWPEWKEISKGWKDTGFLETKEESGEYVKKVWTDTRTLSLMKWTEKHKNDLVE